MATLYIFAGLPGSGKTTLSRLLASELNAVHLRIDTVEQALRDVCKLQVHGEGYRLSYAIAEDNLQIGNDVVADSCNPINLTRSEWEHVAKANDSTYFNIEIVCSDVDEHRDRIESRPSDIPGLEVLKWQDVMEREHDIWSKERIVIDTARRSEQQCFEELMFSVGRTLKRES